MISLAGNGLQWDDTGVLIHKLAAASNRARIPEVEKIRALLPDGEGPGFELEYWFCFLFKPGFIKVWKKRKQVLAFRQLRADATVPLHKGIPELNLVIAIKHDKADVDILKNIHQPVDVFNRVCLALVAHLSGVSLGRVPVLIKKVINLLIQCSYRLLGE